MSQSKRHYWNGFRQDMSTTDKDAAVARARQLRAGGSRVRVIKEGYYYQVMVSPSNDRRSAEDRHHYG